MTGTDSSSVKGLQGRRDEERGEEKREGVCVCMCAERERKGEKEKRESEKGRGKEREGEGKRTHALTNWISLSGRVCFGCTGPGWIPSQQKEQGLSEW